ncbi:MAG: hypothetical protein H0V17_34700 [Deltaproteobacteria bacterium]|nr:hypothetical protein [Deltaproteobacteria bacterium]
MRAFHHTPALPVPPPTPFLLALVALGFTACELARSAGAAHAAPPAPGPIVLCPGAAAPSRADAEPSDDDAGSDAFDDRGDVDADAAAIDGNALALHPAREPAIAEVLSAAYAAAGLDRNPARSWIRRARWAGLIPWLTVRTGRDTNWQTDDPTVDHGMALDVRATWRLDRLAFDGRELQVASIEAARRRERRRLASRVIRTYFAWRRAAARAVHHPATRSRAHEAAAELDALTDGWFSESLASPRRTASESRTVGRR